MSERKRSVCECETCSAHSGPCLSSPHTLILYNKDDRSTVALCPRCAGPAIELGQYTDVDPDAPVWRSIETAPKDGTIIIVWWPCDPPGNWKMRLASWFADAWDDVGDRSELHPTHWMPLPDPPAEQEERR